MPDLSMMKPDPSPSCFSRWARGAGIPNCSRSIRLQGSSIAKRRMYFVLWIVTTAPFTRSTSGATVPGSAPVPAAPGGGAARAAAAARTPNVRNVAAHPRLARERLAAIDDDAAGRIIGRQDDGDLVAENHANAVLAQLSAE